MSHAPADDPAPRDAGGGRDEAQPAAANPAGVAAVVLAVAGALLVVVPRTLVAGWALLPLALLLGVIGLALPGRRRGPAVVALAVFSAGVLAGVAVLLVVIAGAVDDAFR